MSTLPRPPLLPAALSALVSRLPQWPPAAAICAGLNLILLPTLDADMRKRLAGRSVAIQVADAGLDCRLTLTSYGFMPESYRSEPDVTIRACAHDFYRLARRTEDPDTLFFARRLAIEGDTELGLTIKNALDAIDWSRVEWTRLDWTVLPESLLGLFAPLHRAGSKPRVLPPQ